MTDTGRSAAGETPTLREIDTWVFDLDNTLYPAASNVFPQIHRRMTAYISRLLALSEDEARALQRRYYIEHGTTLRGLMLRHGIDADAFLEHVHDVDLGDLPAAPRLERAIGRLPGRKVIFTNSSLRHAERILERLGLRRHFTAIFDIKAAGYVPKPDAEATARLIAEHAIDPARAALFDDIARNLREAARLGMVTVWVREANFPGWSGQTDEDAGHVDHIVWNLADWLDGVAGGGDALS